MYAYHHLLACCLSLDGKESLKKEKGHASTLIGPMATPNEGLIPLTNRVRQLAPARMKQFPTPSEARTPRTLDSATAAKQTAVDGERADAVEDGGGRRTNSAAACGRGRDWGTDRAPLCSERRVAAVTKQTTRRPPAPPPSPVRPSAPLPLSPHNPLPLYSLD